MRRIGRLVHSKQIPANGRMITENASMSLLNPRSAPCARQSTSDTFSSATSRRASAEARMRAYAFGLLASVYQRALARSPCCADIIIPEVQKISVIIDSRTMENGSILAPDRLSAHLEVSDIVFSRVAPQRHRSGGIYISVRRCGQHEALDGCLSITNEWNKPFAETGPMSRFCVCLMDHICLCTGC